ncbi:type 4a pilus biogenesis protein PilO [Candidatus Parcubacteria bacterium]|nr:type 4a pilus biogenesis protein PilO [Candidatus Parcubacteria bacterium]
MRGYKYLRSIRPYLTQPEKKVYTIVGMTLLSLLIFIPLAIRPTLITLSRLLKEIEDGQTALAQLDTKIAALSQAQTNYRQLEPDRNLLKSALPDAPTVDELLEDLALTAGRHRLSLESFQTKKAAPTLNFVIELKGTFENFKKALGEIETNPRLLKVTQVTIAQSSLSDQIKEDSPVLITIELEGYTYTPNE